MIRPFFYAKPPCNAGGVALCSISAFVDRPCSMKNQPRLLAFALLFTLYGCYPMQASLGHLDLMSRRQPLIDIISDASVDRNLKAHLQLVSDIREFASRELGLPNNGSYRNFAQLDREYPVWSVWVTPEFDLRPRQSCFPVIGCVPYRGYYSKESAEGYAEGFTKAGDDVMVGGVTAYSTLGFFDDPVTSTMLRLPEERLAGLVFHELAHQVVYVKGNATFNESFARAVEIEGTLRWLESRHEETKLAHYRAHIERANVFFAQVSAARIELEKLYASDGDTLQKRRAKRNVFNGMREAQRRRKAIDPAWSSFDPWFDDGLNNAKLAAVATYFDDVEMFRKLLGKLNGDFNAFYAAVESKASRLSAATPRSG